MSTPPFQPPDQPYPEPPPRRFGPPPGPAGYPQYAPYGGVEHPQGTMILILGILSLVACGLLGPVAWIMGNNAIAEIDRNPSGYTNRGVIQAGRICGIIASVILIGTILLVILLMAAAGSSGT